jgi:SAM-dependent methyltransferase
MNPEYLKILRCPKSGKPLEIKEFHLVEGKIESGILKDDEGHCYPIVGFVPRFIPESDYCENFSVEWEKHPEILYGCFSNYASYRERFFKETRWGDNLSGQLILEAGCGCGAFTPHALETGATVVSFDASKGIEQSFRINGTKERTLIVQASIDEMPFAPEAFDKIFCFGVLQHTRDPKGSLMKLVSRLKAGGGIVSDIYVPPPSDHPYTGLLRSKYLVRRCTAGIKPYRLHRAVAAYVALVWPISRLLLKIPGLGGVQLNRRLLLDDYPVRLLGMDPKHYKEFACLDIFDMLSPRYDFPATPEEFMNWHQEAGLTQIEVNYGYNGLEGRGIKSAHPDKRAAS